MMQSGIGPGSPGLDDPPLLDFQSATLSLHNQAGFTHQRRRSSTPEFKTGMEGPFLDSHWAKGFFSARDSLLRKCLKDVREQLRLPDPEEGQEFWKDAWLLTMVDHWDNEKERLLLLTPNELVIVKYDFIALKINSHFRLPLLAIKEVLTGPLVYPPMSITPRLQQVASHVTSFFRSDPLRPDHRGKTAIRLRWGLPGYHQPSLPELWNPWSQHIPWLTLLSHPLSTCKGDNRTFFDIGHFGPRVQEVLRASVANLEDNPTISSVIFRQDPVVQDSYIGLPSLLHNTTQLGFFKVRGKVSF